MDVSVSRILDSNVVQEDLEDYGVWVSKLSPDKAVNEASLPPKL